MNADPIHAAIARAHLANEAHRAACRAMRDDESDAADRACNAAAAAASRAVEAVSEARPTTPAGLIALVDFYAEDADGTEIGASHLKSLAATLRACPIRFASAGEPA